MPVPGPWDYGAAASPVVASEDQPGWAAGPPALWGGLGRGLCPGDEAPRLCRLVVRGCSWRMGGTPGVPTDGQAVRVPTDQEGEGCSPESQRASRGRAWGSPGPAGTDLLVFHHQWSRMRGLRPEREVPLEGPMGSDRRGAASRLQGQGLALTGLGCLWKQGRGQGLVQSSSLRGRSCSPQHHTGGQGQQPPEATVTGHGPPRPAARVVQSSSRSLFPSAGTAGLSEQSTSLCHRASRP